MAQTPSPIRIFEQLGRLMRNGFPFVLEGRFVTASNPNGDPEWRVSTDYLLTEVLGLPRERQNNNHTKRLAGIMRRLGWIRSEGAIRLGKEVKCGFTKLCEE